MISSLVGYTGFVGSNLAASYDFDRLYNSKNIQKAYGTNPDLLIYSGLRAEKFLANKFPEQDLASVKEAFSNIQKINPETVVLISTVDIYQNPVGVTEDSPIRTENLAAYGLHRYMLERWIEEEFENRLILRLPALFGRNLKKNFLYDYIHKIPSLLDETKFTELCAVDSSLKSFYTKEDNGFYKCRSLSDSERIFLKDYFTNSGFSALNFTDSRAVFQFYNLENLWNHITTALNQGIQRLNLATEPIQVSDLYHALSGEIFVNEMDKPVPNYDFRTEHADVFGGKRGYLQSGESVLREIKDFVSRENR